ncbi:ATP-binding protein [Planctomycetota bacterium]
MKRNKGDPRKFAELRKNAEEKLKKKPADRQKLQVNNPSEVIHELEVHQIELEMQNEELRRSQVQLEESRSRYSDLYDFAPIGYFVFDSNGLILEVNLSGATLLGVERSYLVKKPFSFYISRDDRNLFYLHRKKSLETKTKQTCEIRLVRKDGCQLYALLDTVAIENSKDNSIHLRTIVHDITERKDAEEKLKTLTTTLKQNMQKIQLDDSRLQALSILNQMKEASTQELIDFALEEAVKLTKSKKGYLNIIHKDQTIMTIHSWSMNKMKQSVYVEKTGLLSEKIQPKETVVIDDSVNVSPFKSGKYEELGVVTRHIDISVADDGQIIATAGVGNKTEEYDDSDIRQLTLLIQGMWKLMVCKLAMEQLKETMEAKSQFISMASHELRTPLTSIKEGIRLVLQGKSSQLDDKQKKFLGLAQRNVDRLARLINNILNFQKLASGKIDFNVQENDANDVVRDIQETMATLANDKKLSLITELDESLPIVKFDRDEIMQVLINLVSNAIKFTDQGGVTITSAKEGNTIRISVQDTGPGIRKEDVPRLFHEFEQLTDVGNRNPGGSGLGLVISKKIIERHNGNIWAESEYGKGTTFHFVLPVEECREKQGE